MRIVFDTNVLLAAMFARGICEALLDTCIISDEHVIVLSDYILKEFSVHANEKFGAPQEQIDLTVDSLRNSSELVKPENVPADSCRDKDDLPILGTAVAGQADCIVTGDQDLLVLRAFRSTEILSPRTLYSKLIKS